MTDADARIELAEGADALPFAVMMTDLLRTNLRDHPEKQADFAAMRGRVALVAEDIDAAITLHFQAQGLRVHRGLRGIPDLVVRGQSTNLVDLSRVPPHRRVAFLPDLRSEPARALARALRARELRFYGLLSHPALGLRLGRVLSIY